MRYFIGFLVAIGLIILLIVLIFSGGGGGDEKKALIPPRSLESYANTDAEASMTIDGPVNANQNHQQIVVTVGTNQVTYQEISGYDGKVTEEQTFHNTEQSYSVFLRSLAMAGFTTGDPNKKLSNEKGRCPLGNRYIFELNENSKQLQRFWITTCGGTKTYLGNTSTTVQLFQSQVPQYSGLSSNIDL